MGDKKNRLLKLSSNIRKVTEFVSAYQYCLRTLLSTLPIGFTPTQPPEIVSIGRADIWPCSDGAVVLFYTDPNRHIGIDSKAPLSHGMNDFLLNSAEAAAHYNVNGTKPPLRASIRVDDASSRTMICMAAPQITEGESIFRTRYQKLFVIGWNADLPPPDELAKEDFSSVYIARNLVGADSLSKPGQELAALTTLKSAELLQQARQLIGVAEREEDVQRFLSEHPQIIYPEYIECYPKHKLGNEYVTDFVFLIQGANGVEYVFVELEKPSKKLFIVSGQPSAEFTQAKDQLNNWERWLTQNLNYAQQTLPRLFQPTYHLIMGRVASLDSAAREKLHVEFRGTTNQFSTYEDVIERFETIPKRVIG